MSKLNYRVVLLCPGYSIISRIMASDDLKAKDYLYRGFSAESTFYFVITNNPLALSTNFHFTCDLSMETEKWGGILFCCFRHNFVKVEDAIRYLELRTRFKIDDVNTDELNYVLNYAKESKGLFDLREACKEKYDEEYLPPLFACQEFYSKRFENEGKEFELSVVGDDAMYGFRLEGNDPEVIKGDAERVYYGFGKALLPRSTNGQYYVTYSPVINNASGEYVLGDEWSRNYIGMLYNNEQVRRISTEDLSL